MALGSAYAGHMIARPDVRFLLRHPAHLLGLSFGAGLVPFAPGTFGTLAAFPLFWWLQPRLAPLQFLVLLGVLCVLGIWICGRTGRALGIEDHRAIVWDETVAFLVVLYFTPPVLIWQAFAFLLFRLFDIFKPGPIRAIEKMFRGGFGVMIDDLAAAFFALLCLALYKTFVPLGAWFGSGLV